MQKVANDYPNIKFAIVDGVIFEADGKTPKKNVASLVFREHEGSYLVGMIAAAKSKTGVLGFVGGMDIPLIHKFETGYEEGAKAVNPNIQVIDNYVGVTDGAWNNPGKGKELALGPDRKRRGRDFYRGRKFRLGRVRRGRAIRQKRKRRSQ